MKMSINEKVRAAVAWGGALRLMIPAAVLFVGVAGCDIDGLMSVDDPEVANPESVRDPSALPVVFAGVLRDFQFAYSGTGAIGGGGDHDSYIVMTGVFTDELFHSGTFPTRREIDRRSIPTTGENGTSDNGQLADLYRNLHRARRSAELADEYYTAAGREDAPERSLAASLAGYTYVFFGEAFCEGVPFSEISIVGAVTEAPSSTRSETFGFAIDRFDHAIAVAEAAGDQDAANLARVGKARALLNENDFAGAAALAAQVPDYFEYVIEHSDNSSDQNNGVFIYAQDSGRYALSEREGGNGLPFVSAGDSRLPYLVNPRNAFDAVFFRDNGIDYIAQNKYSDRNASVVLADGREARLIQAEAAVRTGDLNGIWTNLNAARAIDGLEPLSFADIPDDEAGRVDLLFRERGYSLWLTGHRMGDLRRLVRQYGRLQDDVFPSGAYFRDALQYGTDVTFPIHVDENNNSLFNGCISRDA